ncbi:MAG TPA: HlyD family secretion protein [Steroidobacteraceae bacterium]
MNEESVLRTNLQPDQKSDSAQALGGRKRLLFLVLAALVVGGAFLGWKWWNNARFLVTTDDAYARADSVTISPRVTGYVTEVLVTENQRVHRGDALITIDDTDYQLHVGAAQAAVRSREAAIATLERQIALQQSIIEQASATLLAAQAEADRASAVYQRDRELIKKGYATQEQIDTDKAASLATSAEVAKARALLRQARSESAVLLTRKVGQQADLAAASAVLESARFDGAHTRILAPIDGVVGNRDVQVGAYVRPGKPLFVLVPIEDAYIIANFKETQLGRMRVGQAVTFRLDAYPGLVGHGRVQSFAPATGSEFALLPPQNATGNFTKIVQRVPVRIALSKEAGLKDKIRPGLSAIVSVDTHDGPEARVSDISLDASRHPPTAGATP